MLTRCNSQASFLLSRRLFLTCLLLVIPALACNFTSAISSPTSIPLPSQPASTQPPLPPTPPNPIQPSALPPTVPPVATNPALPPTRQAQPATPSGPNTVKFFLVAINDNGVSGKLIGCGDSLVPVIQEIAPTQGVLRAALEALLGLQQQYYGQTGLYNALYQSNLTIEDVRIENGKATIRLTGRLLLGGVCDNPRLEAQLVETAMQFSTVKEVAIFVNDQPLKDVLSEK
jgi:hypothetical protein